MNQGLRITKILVSALLSAVIYISVISHPAVAQVWYDKLPQSGEYIPVDEHRAKPQDFENLNTIPENAVEFPREQEATEPGDGNSDIPVLPIQRPKGLSWLWGLSILAVAIIIVWRTTRTKPNKK